VERRGYIEGVHLEGVTYGPKIEEVGQEELGLAASKRKRPTKPKKVRRQHLLTCSAVILCEVGYVRNLTSREISSLLLRK